MLVHYPDAGFLRNTRPALQPTPPLAAGAVDPACPSEVWGWFPNVTFPRAFPRRVALSFGCFRTVAGHRAFFPLAPWEDFVRVGARYGVAVLDDAVGPETGCYHAVMTVFAEKARRSDIYLGRHFGCLPDLQTPDADGRRILPDGLGVARGESGRGWTPRELIAVGARILGHSGRPEPGTAVCIAYGLHHAATINPAAPPAPDRRPDAIRNALFADGDPGFPRAELSEELIEEVAVAIADTYRGRVVCHEEEPDWAGDEGLRRLAGIHRSDRLIGLLVGRVQRRGQKRCLEWTAGEIRECIREWYWRSLRYVGAAFSAGADRFLDRAERLGGLSADEVSLFRSMYCCHALYGGLALPVLYDRFNVIEPWLEQVVSSPTDPRPDVLYTLLGYYSLMARERRAVDTTAARSEVTGTDHADEERSRTPDPTDQVADREEIDVIARRVARDQGYSCCAAPRWTGRASGDGRALIVGCEGCGWASPPVAFRRVRQIVGCDAA